MSQPVEYAQVVMSPRERGFRENRQLDAQATIIRNQAYGLIQAAISLSQEPVHSHDTVLGGALSALADASERMMTDMSNEWIRIERRQNSRYGVSFLIPDPEVPNTYQEVSVISGHELRIGLRNGLAIDDEENVRSPLDNDRAHIYIEPRRAGRIRAGNPYQGNPMHMQDLRELGTLEMLDNISARSLYDAIPGVVEAAIATPPYNDNG